MSGDKCDNDQNKSLAASASYTRRQILGAGLAGGVIGVSGITLPISALAGSSKGPPSSPRGRAVVGMSQEPTVFNPLMPGIEVDQGVWWNLFSPLWGVAPDGEFIPQLAREVPTVNNGGVSSDGLKWLVKLRDDVKWHDGEPFTAEDIKFTIDLINNKKFHAGNRTGHNLVRNIKIISPTEIQWEMERAYAPYMALLSWTFIVPRHILEKVEDPNNSRFNDFPIGTGPFKWKERIPGNHITLDANTSFFGAGPYLEQVVFKYIPDMTVLYTQFRTGAVDYTDIAGIAPQHYEEAKKIPGKKIIAAPQGLIESISMNFGKPQFKDKAVRQALYLAMNKQVIIDQVYYSIPEPTESYLPKQSWAYDPNLKRHEFNLKKANKILDESGWKPSSDGIRQKNGVRLEFECSTTAGDTNRQQVQQFLMQTWRQIGVSLKIHNMPPAVMWGDYWYHSKYDTVLVGVLFMVGGDPDASNRFSTDAIAAQGGVGKNTYQYSNPEVDELFHEGTTTMNREKRKQIYFEIQEDLRDDLAILPIFQYAEVQGIDEKLVGLQPNINVQSNSWNIHTWYWVD